MRGVTTVITQFRELRTPFITAHDTLSRTYGVFQALCTAKESKPSGDSA